MFILVIRWINPFEHTQKTGLSLMSYNYILKIVNLDTFVQQFL